MSWIAISLVLVSALLHASWNLLGKKVSPSIAFFSLAFIAGVLPLTPVAFPLIWGENELFKALFPYLLVSGFCQMVYVSGLALAYASGAMSVAYPLARAIPVMLVALVSAALGMSSLSGVSAYLGVVLVLAGAFILPMHHFKDFRTEHYANPSTVLALLAALATTGYSLADKLAIDLMSNKMMHSSLEIAITYIWLQGIFATVFLLILQSFRSADRHNLYDVLIGQKKTALITGSMITITYLLVLWAMQFTENVSYVVALRQASIPIGALLGVFIFKESLGLTKGLALVMLSIGVVLILV